MLISVIIPVYNVEKYVRECLESVVNQTIKDIQIIVVNDGSTDKSREILEEYKNKYNNIIIVDKENEGLGAARNTGLQYALGEYVAFLDSDDYVEFDMYRNMVEVGVKNNSDIVICGIEWVFEDKRNNTVLCSPKKNIEKSEAIKDFLLFDIQGFAWNKIYKKSIFDNYNIKYPEGVYYEDMFVTISSIIHSDRISIIDKAFYKYRQRNTSIIHTIGEKHIEDFSNEVNRCINSVGDSKYENEMLVYKLINFIGICKMIYKYSKNDRCTERILMNNYARLLEENISLYKVCKNKYVKVKDKIMYILIKMNILRVIYTKFIYAKEMK